MRKNIDNLKIQEIKIQRSISNNERENHKKEQSQKTVNGKKIKKLSTKNEEKQGQDELISNAYKNVINVIANLLDNINEEKTNGKPNLQYINESQKKRKSLNKKPVKKLISYTPPSVILSLNQLEKKNSPNKKRIVPLKSLDIIKRKNQNLNVNENLNSSINMDKRKKKITSLHSLNNKRFQAKNLFFKPKNKLKAKWISSKLIFSDDSKLNNEAFFLSKLQKSSIEESRLSNNEKNNKNISSFLSSGFEFSLKTKSQKLKDSFFSSLRDSQKKIRSFYKTNIINSSRSKKSSSKKVSSSPFETLQKNVNIDTETIKQRLYEYENNELTHQINQLPDDFILRSKKKNQKKKTINIFNNG
jgi:hypothetical protein